MPTARELLEQADALMRRNRARADDDIPVLTDAVPSPQEARSHFAPSPRPVETPPGSSHGDDDVPLLTDEVEEIDATAIDAAVDEGEPSVWLDFETAEPSVIGDAPDSIAIVPPVDVRHTEPAPQVEELDELDDELAAAIAAAPAEDEPLLPPSVPAPAPESADWPPPTPLRAPDVIAGGAAALLHGGMAAGASAHGPAMAPAVPPEPTSVAMPSELPPEMAPAVPPEPASVAMPPELAPEMEPASVAMPPELAPEMATVEVAAMLPPDATPAAAAAPDAAHWEAMAEEIRMQVLQRIDLFTDTGLRTQLGERLQPIVDRASADLVATINQHVGELLRAYVAEAIEREIDSWRRNH